MPAAGRARRAGIAITGFIAGALPKIIASWRYYGNPFYSENWRNIALLVRTDDQASQMPRLLDLPFSDPVRIASIWMKRIFADTPEQTIHVIYRAAAFVIPGAVFLWMKYSDRRIWIATSIACIAVIQLTWRIELRCFIPVLPVLPIAAPCGLEQVRGARRTLYFAVAAFLVVTTAAAGISGTARLLRLQSPELKQAGEYVNNLAAAISARNVRWIVADNRLAQEVPGLTWLDDEALTHARFPNWKVVRFGGDLHVLVWEIPADQAIRDP